jgi:hypothetical protein
VATILVTANPWLIWTIKNPAPTTTATFFTALGGYLFARVSFSSAGKGRMLCLCLGGVCALAALDHPPLIGLVVGFTVALFLIIRRSHAMSAVLSVTLLWIGFAVCLAPYTFRNFGITRRFVPITDSGGFSYFMGTGLYQSSIYPVGDYRDFSKLAARLHVSVPELDEKFYTIDDHFYPLLSRMAKQDVETQLLQHPSYLLCRTFVMSLWFWFAGDKFVWMSVLHFVYWLLFALAIFVAFQRRGLATIAPFIVVVIPGMLLHGLSMPLIGYAAYSIPYTAILAVPLALGVRDSHVIKGLFHQESKITHATAVDESQRQ